MRKTTMMMATATLATVILFANNTHAESFAEEPETYDYYEEDDYASDDAAYAEAYEETYEETCEESYEESYEEAYAESDGTETEDAYEETYDEYEETYAETESVAEPAVTEPADVMEAAEEPLMATTGSGDTEETLIVAPGPYSLVADANDPDAQYYWAEDGDEFVEGRWRYQVNVQQTTTYTCVVTNGEESVSLTYEVVVDNQFCMQGGDPIQNLIQGESLTVTVNAYNQERMSFVWYKDDVAIGHEQSVAVFESGYYTCVANDGFGTSHSVRYKVNVQENVRSLEVCGNRMLRNGETTLRALVDASDVSQLQYFWNGEEGSDTYVTTSAGTYVCVVKDQYGNEKASDITVYDNNLRLSVPSEMQVENGATVSLSAAATARDTSGLCFKWVINGKEYNSETATFKATRSLNAACAVTDGYGNKVVKKVHIHVHAWKWTTKQATVWSAGVKTARCSCGGHQRITLPQVKPSVAVSKTEIRVKRGKTATFTVTLKKGDKFRVTAGSNKVRLTSSGNKVTVKGVKKGRTKIIIVTSTGLKRVLWATILK